jgi:CRP-like cAMP-binding protein
VKAAGRQALQAVLRAAGPVSGVAVDDVLALARERVFAKNDSFATAGETPSELGFVVDGVFRAFLRNEDGREYNKTFFPEGTFLMALSALVTGEPNRIDLQALTPATLLVMDYRAFTTLYDRHHDLERVARRLIEVEWAKKEQREIALVLDDAASRYENFQREHPGLENRIPQYHIASYLGITPIHLSRIRSRRASHTND